MYYNIVFDWTRTNRFSYDLPKSNRVDTSLSKGGFAARASTTEYFHRLGQILFNSQGIS
jgi:hypothetical protein